MMGEPCINAFKIVNGSLSYTILFITPFALAVLNSQNSVLLAPLRSLGMEEPCVFVAFLKIVIKIQMCCDCNIVDKQNGHREIKLIFW